VLAVARLGLAAVRRPRLGTMGAVGHGFGGSSVGAVGAASAVGRRLGLAAARRPRFGATRAVGHGSSGGSRGGGAVVEGRRARWLAAARWRSACGTCGGGVHAVEECTRWRSARGGGGAARVRESAFIPFVSFGDLDNNTFKGLTSLLSVEQEIQYDEHT
jgi:hypothetical protein